MAAVPGRGPMQDPRSAAAVLARPGLALIYESDPDCTLFIGRKLVEVDIELMKTPWGNTTYARNDRCIPGVVGVINTSHKLPSEARHPPLAPYSNLLHQIFDPPGRIARPAVLPCLN